MYLTNPPLSGPCLAQGHPRPGLDWPGGSFPPCRLVVVQAVVAQRHFPDMALMKGERSATVDTLRLRRLDNLPHLVLKGGFVLVAFKLAG